MKKLLAILLLSAAFLSSCNVDTIYINPPDSEYGTKTEVSPLPDTHLPTPTPQTSQTPNTAEDMVTENPGTQTDNPPPEPTPPITNNGVTPTPDVPVIDDSVKSITLDVNEVTLYVGNDHTPKVTVLPEIASNKDYRLESSDPSVALIKNGSTVSARGQGTCSVKVISAENNEVFATVDVTVLHTPEGEITYIEGILIANKTFALPSTYAPGVDPEAKEALNSMFAAAKADGLKLFICSGYRTYAYQASLYNNYVKKDGKEKADTYSARPGHSEHQTGLAFDLNKVDSSFEGTPEANWIAAHAHEYGFIVRYPKGKQEITGYKYEPWHVRYIGVEMATAVYESGLCLEEFLGITSVYAY